MRQGDCISPLLFTVYLDVLLIRLRASGIGCRLDNVYFGALSYADDVALLCPSRMGLEKLLEIARKYAEEYDVTFNPNKSQLLLYPAPGDSTEAEVTFMGNTIRSSASATHLGIAIGPETLKDKVKKAKSELFSPVHLLMSQFGHCTPDVRYRLFVLYCGTFHGSNLLDFDHPHTDELFVAWRKCARRVLGLHPQTHCRLIHLIGNDIPLETKMHRMFVKFLQNCLRSENQLVRKCAHVSLHNSPNCVQRNLSVIRQVYGIRRDIIVCGSNSPKLNFHANHEDLMIAQTINEFRGMNTEDPEDRRNIQEIIEHLCID